jgi:Protein of unknown function (DUF2796)
MKSSITLALTGLLLASSLAHAAEHAHSHGEAKLDLAVEPTRITIQLESPLNNLVGFERAPRTDKERQQVDAALAKLKAADLLFKIDPTAQCKLASVELASAALKLGKPDPEEEKAGHADIDGSFEFACADATKANYIELGLFEFSRMQRLEVQVATAKGQFKRTLKRPASRLMLTK